VGEPPSRGRSRDGTSDPSGGGRALACDKGEAAEYLAGLADRCAAVVDLETLLVVRESIPDAIIEGLGPGTLVCMSSHGRGGLSRAVMGSIAEALLLTLDRPTLVVGPYLAEGGTVTGRIVAGIDGSRRAAARGQRIGLIRDLGPLALPAAHRILEHGGWLRGVRGSRKAERLSEPTVSEGSQRPLPPDPGNTGEGRSSRSLARGGNLASGCPPREGEGV
jgi:hypothetical protein